jgi:hypothetical protein
MFILGNAEIDSVDDRILESGAPSPSSAFTTGETSQAEFFPETDGTWGPQSLEINNYVKWDDGGKPGPVDNLGWNTGSSEGGFRRWLKFMGQVLIPANTAAINASQMYGNVGLDNRNQVLVAQYAQQNSQFLPSQQELEAQGIAPGWGM